MAFKQYTQCYAHTPGDKPFNEDDLVAFVLGASGAAAIAALIAFIGGAFVVGGVFMAIGYAQAIIAVANEWLFHRLACIGDKPKCAVGTVEKTPEVGGFGEFDNDEFFDVRLLPHRPGDFYKDFLKPANTAFNPAGARASQDGLTENRPENDLLMDGFQGQALLKPVFDDLSYVLDSAHAVPGECPFGLHCEAEGNFWQAMKDYAAIMAIAVGVGSAAGAAAGAAAGCAIGGFFGPLGCLIGAIIGAIIGALAGGGLAAYIGAQVAFHSDPGNVEDANVGDANLGPIGAGDRVAVYGRHVYDGFHQGWHEFHPLMAVVKVHPNESSSYIEWDPNFADPAKLPVDTPDMPVSITKLTVDDMKEGLASKKFRERAIWLRDKWCNLLHEAFDGATRVHQLEPDHRWTIHPAVDGCVPEEPVPK